MRITYALLNAYATGGTIRTVFNQANEMAQRGHDVDIISVHRHVMKPTFPLEKSIAIRPLVDFGPREDYTRMWYGLRNRVEAMRGGHKLGTEIPDAEIRKDRFTREAERRVIKAFRNIDTDVLVTTRPALNLLAARYAPSRVLRIGQEHQHLKRHKKGLRKAIDADYPQLDAVVTLTEFDRKNYVKAFRDTLRVERVPNALHTLDTAQADLDRKVVVAAGRLSRLKGFDRLVPAFAQVVERNPDWRLDIYGDGPKLDELKQLIGEYGMHDHIRLKGHTNRLGQKLTEASIYALSSRSEGFPMIVLEALSHGLPVVSYDIHGAHDILTDGTEGLLVPPDDVNTLAKGICQLIEDPETRHAMGANARETALKYGPGSATSVWQKLFTELLEAKRA